MRKRIKIETPSRLHLGFIELNHNSDRSFGSLGLTIDKYKNVIEIYACDKFRVISENIDIKKRVENIFKIFLKKYKIKVCGFKIQKFIPQHIGLGSGTQLSLGIGLLISDFNNLKLSLDQISLLLKRGLRSGIGIESFKSGGFIVDGGKKRGTKLIPQIIINHEWPTSWKIILILDKSSLGVSGGKEIQEFKKIKKVNSDIAKNNSIALVKNILPGLVEKNFNEFTKGLEIIQRNMSKIFYPKKKKFTSLKIEKIFTFLKKNNVNGLGQTSWGPTGFVFCENLKKRNQLFYEIENYIKRHNISDITLERINGKNNGFRKIGL